MIAKFVSFLWFFMQIVVVNSEEEMGRLQVDNAIVLRKDKRMLYYKDKDGWSPIQVIGVRGVYWL